MPESSRSIPSRGETLNQTLSVAGHSHGTEAVFATSTPAAYDFPRAVWCCHACDHHRPYRAFVKLTCTPCSSRQSFSATSRAELTSAATSLSTLKALSHSVRPTTPQPPPPSQPSLGSAIARGWSASKKPKIDAEIGQVKIRVQDDVRKGMLLRWV